jgi:V8-like Glu-specific endopeptidase
LRTIGAINTTQTAGDTFCTATKIGPRHLLTAAHCVVNEDGSFVMTSGWFHPGQTNNAHPNTGGTPVRWSGFHYRWPYPGDSAKRWDYALLYLEDRLDSYQLGWYGVAYSHDPNWYGYDKWAMIHGYPIKSYSSNVNRCKASPLLSKNCDGWMYTDGRYLETNAFRSDEQLQFDIDATLHQSGSALWIWYNFGGGNTPNVLGVLWGCAQFGGCSGRNRAARFRDSMWNDICSWIAQVPSAHGQHPLCH